MTIDPRWSFFLSLGLAILGFLAGASAQFADLGLAPSTTKAILASLTLLLGVGNAINAVLAAIPAKSEIKTTEAVTRAEATKFYLGPQANAPPHS